MVMILDGLEWRSVTRDNSTIGYSWDPDNAYADASKTKLKPDYYNQAIYFSDKGTFSEKQN